MIQPQILKLEPHRLTPQALCINNAALNSGIDMSHQAHDLDLLNVIKQLRWQGNWFINQQAEKARWAISEGYQSCGNS